MPDVAPPSLPLPQLYHLGGHLGVVHRRIQRAEEARLAHHRVSPAQARLIRTLARLGRPLQMSELAAALDIVPRSVTSVVDELEPMGLVVRQRGDGDGRQVFVSLTDDGHATVAELVDLHGASVAAVLGDLAPHEIAMLADLLGNVAHGPDHGSMR